MGILSNELMNILMYIGFGVGALIGIITWILMFIDSSSNADDFIFVSIALFLSPLIGMVTLPVLVILAPFIIVFGGLYWLKVWLVTRKDKKDAQKLYKTKS